MTRLLVHVEGETEESFVNWLLAPHLQDRGFSSVSARLLGNARLRANRGGIRPWNTTRDDIVRHLQGDRDCVATTMVDYYGLPDGGRGAWPGRGGAAVGAAADKAAAVEAALADDVADGMGTGFDRRRFVPHVTMHEFEALLFSDCERFGAGIGRPDLGPRLQAIRDAFANPEEIDDSPVTAPSKRVARLMPGYRKPLLGTFAALEIGLSRMRGCCPHFADWLARLEARA